MFTLKEIEKIRDRAYTQSNAIGNPAMNWALRAALIEVGEVCDHLVYEMMQKEERESLKTLP